MVLTGFMGAGKSTIGPRLAQSLGWTFIDLDEEIVRAQQKSIAQIFDSIGEARFRDLEKNALDNILGPANAGEIGKLMLRADEAGGSRA